MRILDRYLLKQFIRTFVICFFSLTGLFIVIDAFQHLNHFLAFAEGHGSLLGMMGEHYLYRSLDIFNQISGFLAFISAIFTVTWIQRHNELTALSAAGVPTSRVIKPIIFAAIFVSLFAAANRELIIPRLREQLAQDPRDLAGTKAHPVKPRFDNQTKVWFTGKSLSRGKQRIENPRLKLPSTLSAFGQEIAASEAFYQQAHGEQPCGYMLRGVTIPKTLAGRNSIYSANGEPIILSPHDTSWLKPDECFVCSQLPFEMLADGKAWQSHSSTFELIRRLHNPSTDFVARDRVAVHGRIVQPFLDTTLVLLGLPFVLSRGTRNMFMAIGLCLGIVVVFMVATIACQYLGNLSFISPALAAWLPLIIFIPITAWTSVAWRQ